MKLADDDILQGMQCLRYVGLLSIWNQLKQNMVDYMYIRSHKTIPIHVLILSISNEPTFSRYANMEIKIKWNIKAINPRVMQLIIQ